jgi:hypothetical protein
MDKCYGSKWMKKVDVITHAKNINFFVMQVENIEKYYIMCQNAF